MRSGAIEMAGLLIVVFAVVGLAGSADAVVIACSETALRTAINGAATVDTIEIPTGCTIVLTGAANDDANVSGDLDIRANTAATSLSIRGGGPLTTVIDGSAVDRVFDIGPGKAVAIENLTIRNGDATISAVTKDGGGVRADNASVSLLHVHLTGNKASAGGGLAALNGASISLLRVTISLNTATTGGGGGARLAGNDAFVDDITVSDNTSQGSGGGIEHAAGTLDLTNVTIANNTVLGAAGQGGGLRASAGSTLTNVILAGNTVPQSTNGPDCFSVQSATSTLIQDATGCAITTSTNNQLNQPANLGPLQNNGGGTPTRMPGPGSLAIDRGTNTNCLGIDQRARPRPVNSTCDIGALEVRSPIFADVPATDPFWPWVEDLATAKVTFGCTAATYCPGAPTTREQMAVFILKAVEGANFTPPACSSAPFGDVPCASPFAAWIQELVVRGITSGCGGGLYCPTGAVSREQMAVFLLKALLGASHTPPPCRAPGPFPDVPCASVFAPWVQELVDFTITAGCGGGLYCPASPVTRAQMAVFLVKTFDLPHFFFVW
jgi:hypothetical protein